MGADYGSLQRYDAARNALKLVNHYGLADAKVWEWIFLDTPTTCGRCLKTRRRVIVPDIETCDFLDASRELFRVRGIRAVQSTPLIAPDGHLLGTVSTHWRQPHQLHDEDFILFDVWTKQTADMFALYEEVSELLQEASDKVARSNEQVDRCQALLNRLNTQLGRDFSGYIH